MDKREAILHEIETVPESVLDEVLDFVRILKEKDIRDTMSLATASEFSLRKDWLKPEEDEAWRGL